jgi:hypothetical protein
VNIAGRLLVGTGNNVGIAGFIMNGGTSKKVLLRAIGPSLSGSGVTNPLQDPVLELHDSTGAVTVNNDWRTNQETEIQQTGLAPSDSRESAIIATLAPGNSSVIIKGSNDSTGIGVVEVYDLQPGVGQLGNLSVRANIGINDNILIAGVIIGAGEARRTVFRGIGPALKSFGIPAALDDTTLELRDANGVMIGSNDNWQDAPNSSELNGTGLAPTAASESALLITLGPGHYTSIVRGANNSSGVGLAEAYKLDN